MSSSYERRRVLVLDDEPTARLLMKKYLGLYGYDAIEAGSVDQAVASLKRDRVDAVILDMGLAEERTGLDVLRTLRRSPGLEKLPAIILSGKVFDEAEELSIARERAYVFHKPENLDVVIQFLDRMLSAMQPQPDREAIG
jgi:CheY-like chemotaxis protein